MTYAIIAWGTVGSTLARLFAARNIPVQVANLGGPQRSTTWLPNGG